MNFIISICLLVASFLLQSCTLFSRKLKLSEIAKKDSQHLVRISSVSNASVATTMIENRIRYLQLLFEQVENPYHEIPRWEPHCYADNQIGKLQKNGDVVFAVSRLYLDSKQIEGFCSDKFFAAPGYSVEVYCPDKQAYLQYKFRSPDFYSWERIDLCN